jgi:hypothetical protein
MVLNCKPVWREIQFADRTQYYLADTANNFALFRREMLADYHWTEPLKLREHADYYWRVKQAGRWKVAVCEQVRCKHLRIQSPEYQEHRHRNHEFLSTMLALAGLKELKILPGNDSRMGVDSRPNIVVLGVGNSGTTIVTKMLHARGGQVADADETFGESVGLRNINESGDFNRAAEYLAGLPQPWAIKDPRLVRTLGRWQPFVAPYKPLLLWVIRHRESVLESKRKRGVPREKAAQHFDSQIRQANRLYAAWTGLKCWPEYERLADAVGLWREGNGKLSRDRAREVAVRFGTEWSEAELDRLYDAACRFSGEKWRYVGQDAGGLWMVTSGLPVGVRLVCCGVRSDVVQRVSFRLNHQAVHNSPRFILDRRRYSQAGKPQ